MSKRVLLVAYEDQDNLGIRYLSSRLLRAGHHTRIIAFADDPGILLTAIREEQADLVGFSLIFQYLVPEFARLIRALRAAGITAHFTIGGHYASFEPAALLEAIPELDSIVRFEGEETLAELVSQLDNPAAWRQTPGIAWLDEQHLPVLTPARQATPSIDDYLEPDRRDINYRRQALPTASVLASRGCPWQCSFCSIITFYEANGTKGRRRRSPALVADEVERLVNEHGVELILFQDDDFLAGGPVARDWAKQLAADFRRRGLQQRMRFKIACRSDEIRADVVQTLIDAGLCHVYLGVESGDPDNLIALNKHLQPEIHLRAGQILRRLDLSFDFGFMLLEPWSTLATARNNLDFLRRFTEDGWIVAGFCRTLPYVGTPVEQRLRAEGRLVGPALEAEYRFLDRRVDLLWDFCLMAFEGRNYGHNPTWNLLRGLLFETHLDFPGRPRDNNRDAAARALVQAANGALIDILQNALDLIEDGLATSIRDPELIALARLARNEDRHVRQQLLCMASDGS